MIGIMRLVRRVSSNYELDVSRKPFAVTIQAPRAGLFIVALFGVVFGGVAPMFALAGGAFDPISSVVFPVIGVGVLFFAFLSFRWRLEIRIDGDRVTVRERSIKGWSEFIEPLANYRGVQARSEYRSHRNSRGYVLQYLDLVHADPARTVPLLRAKQDVVPRAEWEAYAKTFDLPALQLDGDRVVQRDVADLDKSLKELAEEGKVVRPATTVGPPPKSVNVAAGADQIAITTFLSPIIPLIGGVFLFIAGVGPFSGGMDAPPIVAMLIGGVMTVIGLCLLIGFFVGRVCILIRRDRIESFFKFPIVGRLHHQSMAHDDIEAVTVRHEKGNAVKSLVLEGDANTMTVVQGVSRKRLEWLRDYMTEAVITA